MRMYHTAAQNFNPSGTFTEAAALPAAFETTDIHLCTWLRKREMMRTEFCPRLRSEQFLGKYLQCSLQIRKRNVLIYYQPFDLMKGRRMRRIHLIGTEHPSRRDHTNRQFSLFHHTGLHRGCLGTQHNFFVNIERILLVLCRVIRRNIKFFKIIQIILYLRPFHNLISHSHEDPLYLFQCNRIGMAVTHTVFPGRQCYINDLRLQLLCTDGFFHLSLCLFHHRFNGSSCLIYELPDLRPFLRGHLLHPLQHSRQFSLFSKKPDTHVIEFLRHIRCLYLRQRFFLNLFQSFLHSGFSFLLLLSEIPPSTALFAYGSI